MNRPALLLVFPVVAVALAAGLGACGDRNGADSGKSPLATGLPSSLGQTGNSGATVMATPAAPDSAGGGSTGFKGVAPLPDTSGGPSSGPRPAGAGPNTSVAGPVSGDSGTMRGTGNGVSTNGGLPASALGNGAGPRSNTNSSSNSNTGNAAR